MISSVPLQLTHFDDKTIQLWGHPRSSSTQISFIFTKETMKRIFDEIRRIQDQVEVFHPTLVTIY